jgi:hypothetical protein
MRKSVKCAVPSMAAAALVCSWLGGLQGMLISMAGAFWLWGMVLSYLEFEKRSHERQRLNPPLWLLYQRVDDMSLGWCWLSWLTYGFIRRPPSVRKDLF